MIVAEKPALRRLAWRSYRRDKDRRAAGEVKGLGKESRPWEDALLDDWLGKLRARRLWWCLWRRSLYSCACLSRRMDGKLRDERRKVNLRMLLVELASRLLNSGLNVSIVRHPKREGGSTESLYGCPC